MSKNPIMNIALTLVIGLLLTVLTTSLVKQTGAYEKVPQSRTGCVVTGNHQTREISQGFPFSVTKHKDNTCVGSKRTWSVPGFVANFIVYSGFTYLLLTVINPPRKETK